MPVAQKKPITSKSSVSTLESSSPLLPKQEEFRQHLRRLAVSAVQVLIEHVMCEELERHGENALPIAGVIAMGPLPVT
jgi:putative transposase